MLIVDAHNDITWNMLTFGRDYTRSAVETRQREYETGSPAPEVNGYALLGYPEYRRGRVGLVFATLFAAPERWKSGAWDQLIYADADQAHRLYSQQVDLYDRLTDDHPEHFRRVLNRRDLQAGLEAWRRLDESGEEPQPPEVEAGQVGEWEPTPQPAGPPVGLVLLMEGAEGVRHPGELEEWWARGVRLIGPAWGGTRFCGGTKEPGALTRDGFALLDGMAGLGFILDISHMDEPAALEALEVYPGPVVATHANAAALLRGSDSNRHLSDRVIHGLIERNGVIGVVPFNGYLKAGWLRGDRREGITLQHVIAHIDYICQVAGDARHVAIGSDFDGGFGLQGTPEGIQTVADLQKLGPLLADRGYSEADVAAIFSQNWLDRLEPALPE